MLTRSLLVITNDHFLLLFLFLPPSAVLFSSCLRPRCYLAAETMRTTQGSLINSYNNWSWFAKKKKEKTKKNTPGSWGWTRGSHPDHDFLAMQRSWPLMFECSNMTLFVLSESPFRLLPIIPEPWTLLWDKRVVATAQRNSRFLSGEHFISQAVMRSFVLTLTPSIT